MTMLNFDAAKWRKSSRSSDQANCVEIAFALPAVGVRDSKSPGGSVLVFSEANWAAFLGGLSQ